MEPVGLKRCLDEIADDGLTAEVLARSSYHGHQHDEKGLSACMSYQVVYLMYCFFQYEET